MLGHTVPQSLSWVCTLCLCVFKIISHSWNTSLSQYGWENQLFPFLSCNPSFFTKFSHQTQCVCLCASVLRESELGQQPFILGRPIPNPPTLKHPPTPPPYQHADWSRRIRPASDRANRVMNGNIFTLLSRGGVRQVVRGDGGPPKNLTGHPRWPPSDSEDGRYLVCYYKWI